MKAQELLEELEKAATDLEIKVSYEAIAATVGLGGLCRVKGAYRVIIDKRASASDRANTLAHALSRFDTSSLVLSQEARTLIGPARMKQAS